MTLLAKKVPDPWVSALKAWLQSWQMDSFWLRTF